MGREWVGLSMHCSHHSSVLCTAQGTAVWPPKNAPAYFALTGHPMIYRLPPTLSCRAAECFELARALYYDSLTQHIAVHILAIDAVPGPSARKWATVDRWAIMPNVRYPSVAGRQRWVRHEARGLLVLPSCGLILAGGALLCGQGLHV